jgi:GNAT superfamily N-acetyltransferase
MDERIQFKDLSEFDRGILYGLLCESYAGLLEARAGYAQAYRQRWRKLDDDAFDHLGSIGRCSVSVVEGKPIGFVSWDPRELPRFGRIGQNCIVPFHRGKGYGKTQIRKAVSILRQAGAESIVVTTANHPFFIPAQRMYVSCGFLEVGRSHTDDFGGHELIEYRYTGEAL